jgi:hypothetical protein
VSDLSRLLGDVYGASTPATEDAEADPTTPPASSAPVDDPPGPPVEAVESDLTASAAPGWADEAVLDEAFAEWVPGPPSDADAEERDILADVEPAETVAEPIDIDAWLGDEVTDIDEAEAAVETEADELEPTAAMEAADAFVPPAEAMPEPHSAMESEGHWRRESDDLLPRGRRSRRLSLTLRR